MAPSGGSASDPAPLAGALRPSPTRPAPADDRPPSFAPADGEVDGDVDGGVGSDVDGGVGDDVDGDGAVPPPGRPAEGDTPARGRRVPAGGDPPAPRWPRWQAYGVAGGLYLAVSLLVWWHAWSSHPSASTLCGCGDPALFTWFLEWPAYALTHGHNPFYSTALFHPTGVNLLSNTSVLAFGIPLTPVTLAFGPVATLNVALTLSPLLNALSAFWLLRRWVSWSPAAFIGGLLFGFSPFVLNNLSFAHLMTGCLAVVPLWVGVLDALLIRGRSPVRCGIGLAVLALVQFFVSTEVLAILLMSTALGLVVLVVYGAVAERAELAARWRPALTGLVVAGVGTVVLVGYPAWFALAGPAHLQGEVWPQLPQIGGSFVRSLVDPGAIPSLLPRLGGYLGTPLPSASYFGWGLLAVAAAGLVLWWRDRRLQFFAVMAVLAGTLSLGENSGHWMPWSLFADLPVVDNIIEQRFVAISFLAVAVMLAVVLDRLRRLWLPGGPARSPSARWARDGARWALAGGVAAVALVPLATSMAPALPFYIQGVDLPRWYVHVAPRLPAGQVVLAYPSPSPWIQTSLTWQAVDRLHFTLPTGGGPQGTLDRAGREKPGWKVLSQLSYGLTPSPTGTPAQLAAVRRALGDWRVDIVVITYRPGGTPLVEGRDPPYAAAFMTAVIGRPPVVQDGAWVWYGVRHLSTPLRVDGALLQACAAPDTGPHAVPSTAVGPCVARRSAAVITGRPDIGGLR